MEKCSKKSKNCLRAYGGVLSAGAVRHRILRAFLNEELKCIKRARYAPKGGKKNKGGQNQKSKKK